MRSWRYPVNRRRRGGSPRLWLIVNSALCALIVLLCAFTSTSGSAIPQTAQATSTRTAAQLAQLPTATTQSAPQRTTVSTPQVTFTATVDRSPTPTATPPVTLVPSATPAVSPTPPTSILPQRPVVLPAVPIGASNGISATAAYSNVTIAPPAPAINMPPGTINIALLGIDARPGENYSNTDVIIIASVNLTAKDGPQVTMLPVPRDLLVYIPGWRSHKINTAYPAGGINLLRQTIRYNLGVNIDYYVLLNFAGLIKAVDVLEGVEVVATCPLYQVFPKDPYYLADELTPMIVRKVYTDTFSGQVWQPGQRVPLEIIDIKSPGVVKLNGLQALAFARARYGVVGGDLDRNRREKRLIRAIITKAKQVGALPKIPQLVTLFANEMKTDLSLSDMLTLAGYAASFNEAGAIRSRNLDAGVLRGELLPEVGSVFVYNPFALQDNVRRIFSENGNASAPTDAPTMLIENATADVSMGRVVAERMIEQGFRIVDVKQVSPIQPKTRLIQYSAKDTTTLATMQRLFAIGDAQRQPAQAGTSTNADFRLIVGQDFNPCSY